MEAERICRLDTCRDHYPYPNLADPLPSLELLTVDPYLPTGMRVSWTKRALHLPYLLISLFRKFSSKQHK